MKVIGTAGHIDHGKSTLVKRLTGIDPDRLDEEKRRGMTIDLGFAHVDLPSGTRASIVDVPGHERFVHNMLAGAGGIDLALIVVAADESVMPQTREHVAILDLLGVEYAVVAVTKADGVDDNLVELVSDEMELLLAETGLAGATIVAVDSVSGRGIDALITTLDGTLARVPPRPDIGAPYLPIDRVFSRPGFGTVVTGTLHDGSLRVGGTVDIVPVGGRARVRGLQIHNSPVESAPAGTRVAVNLAGIAVGDLRRGDALARDGALRVVERFDARVLVLPDSPVSLRSGLTVRVHVGAAEIPGRVQCLDVAEVLPGMSGWTRIVLSGPVAARRGQRFVLRLPSPVGTVAGGKIVDTTPRRGRRPEIIARLEALGADRLAEAVLAALGTRPWTAPNLAARMGEAASLVSATLQELTAAGVAVAIGETYVATSAWNARTHRVKDQLAVFHREHPLRPGVPKEVLRQAVRWPAATWPAAVLELVRSGVVVEREGAIALSGHIPIDPEGYGNRVCEILTTERFSPPDVADVLRRVGAGREVLGHLTRQGRAVRVSDELYFSREAYDDALRRVAVILESEGAISIGRVRDELGTSRKYALALLEHLDREKLTRRAGDARVAGSREIPCV